MNMIQPSRFAVPISSLILFGVLAAIFLVPLPVRAVTEADCPWWKYFYAECVGLRNFQAFQPNQPVSKPYIDFADRYPLFSRGLTNKDINDMCTVYFGRRTTAEAECLDNAYIPTGIRRSPKWIATDALLKCSNLSGTENRTCVENEFQKRADELREDKRSDAEDTIPTPLSEKAATVSYNDEDAPWGTNPRLDEKSGGVSGGATFDEDGNIIAEPQPSAYAQRTIDSFLGMPARKASGPAFSDYTTSYSNWNIKERSATEREMLGDYGSTQISNTFLNSLLSRRQESDLSIPSPASDDRWGQSQANAGGWRFGPLSGLVSELFDKDEPILKYEPVNQERVYPDDQYQGIDIDANLRPDFMPVYIEQPAPASYVDTVQTDSSLDYYLIINPPTTFP